MKTGWSQSRPGRYVEEKNLFPLLGIEPILLNRPTHRLVAISTELSRLVVNCMSLFAINIHDIKIIFQIHFSNHSCVQPPIQRASGAAAPGVKEPGLETDHSSLSSSESANGGAISPLPICLHVLMLNQ
jgi:hypothetical protein